MKNILFADFETNTESVSTTSTNVNLWCIIDKDDKIYHGVDLDNFMNQIFEYKKATIYFHNLSFDGQYILYWLVNNDFEIVSQYQKPTNENFVEILADGKIFYQIKITTKNSKIKILCSYKLFAIGVKQLGQILRFEKLNGEKWYDRFALIKDKKLKSWKIKNNKFNEKNEIINYYSNLKQFYKILQNQGFHLDGKFEYKNDCECYLCYCIKDTIIVKKYFIVFTNQDLKIGMTTASTAKKTMADFLIKSNEKDNNLLELKFIFKKIFGKKIMKVSSWKTFQNSYYGGFTSYNHEKPIFNENLDGYSADVNSMYPAVMTQNIAIGEIRDKPDYYIENGFTYEKLVMVEVWKIDIKPGKPAIWPAKSKFSGILQVDKKYKSFPYNENRIYHFDGEPTPFLFWEKEWEYIKECYNYECNVFTTGFVQTTDAFSYYVKKYYNLKTDAKNVSERSVYKLLLNASYGKLGQKIERDEHIYIDFKKAFDWEKIDKNENFNKKVAPKTREFIIKMIDLYQTDKDKYLNIMKRRRDFFFYDSDRTITKILVHQTVKPNLQGYQIERLSSIVSASYITMLARLELYKVIIPNFNIWLYADTDSAYFTKKPELQIDNKALGFWKWEKRFNKMKILRAKVYSVEQTYEWDDNDWLKHKIEFGSQKTTAISGHKLDENQVITPENFERGILNPRLQNQAKLVRGGILIVKIKKKL